MQESVVSHFLHLSTLLNLKEFNLKKRIDIYSPLQEKKANFVTPEVHTLKVHLLYSESDNTNK